MIQEFLVILACSQNAGCSQTTSSYYQTHPAVKQSIQTASDTTKKAVGPEVVAISPAILLMGTGKGTFSVNKYISIQITTKDTKMILFKVTF